MPDDLREPSGVQPGSGPGAWGSPSEPPAPGSFRAPAPAVPPSGVPFSSLPPVPPPPASAAMPPAAPAARMAPASSQVPLSPTPPLPGAVPPPPPASPAVVWQSQPPASPSTRQGFPMDHGPLADRRLWLNILKIVGWVLLVVAVIGGIVAFFQIRAAGEALAYFGQGNPFTGTAALVMVMTWAAGVVTAAFIMVYANMAEDINRLTALVESRR